MQRVILTSQGAEQLQQELKKLTSVQRPQVIAAIAEARSHGDLSENAEYDAAREQQGFIEGRIKELESQLSIAQVIDPKKLNISDKVVFGAHVTLYDEILDKEIRYQIVGDLEADIDKGQISLSSPIGGALIGKYVGDEVEITVPNGKKHYEVIAVSDTA